jgi:hypothetical protein
MKNIRLRFSGVSPGTGQREPQLSIFGAAVLKSGEARQRHSSARVKSGAGLVRDAAIRPCLGQVRPDAGAHLACLRDARLRVAQQRAGFHLLQQACRNPKCCFAPHHFCSLLSSNICVGE